MALGRERAMSMRVSSGARPRAVQTATFARARTYDSGDAARRPPARESLEWYEHVPDIIEIDAVDTLHEVESTSSLTCTGAP